MTLVEVLAGLALLATVVAGLLAAQSRSARQWSEADRRLRAVAAADALLAAWWADPRQFPRAGEGRVESEPGLVWRARVVPNPAARDLGGEVVRLEVRGVTGGATGAGAALVAVDVVLPAKRPLPPRVAATPADAKSGEP